MFYFIFNGKVGIDKYFIFHMLIKAVSALKGSELKRTEIELFPDFNPEES